MPLWSSNRPSESRDAMHCYVWTRDLTLRGGLARNDGAAD